MKDWKVGGMMWKIARLVVRCGRLEGWWYDVEDWKAGGGMM